VWRFQNEIQVGIKDTKQSMPLRPQSGKNQSENTKNMLKIISIITALASLTLANAQAGLGWTLAECKQHYGKQIKAPYQTSGRTCYTFASKGYLIGAVFLNNTVARVIYYRDLDFDLGRVNTFLQSNAPEATWAGPEKNDTDGSYRFQGVVDGEIAYYASVSPDSKVLGIWTIADDNVIDAVQQDDAKNL
jgi:hypothetical protein